MFAALSDTLDSIHTFWSAADPYGTDELVCDGFTLDGYTAWAGACLDDSGRVQCVWARDGKLKFALVPEPTLEVGAVSGLSCCDITTDTLSQPVIAYCLDDGSIYVAHGVDVVGQSEEPQEPTAHDPQIVASVVRSVLFLPVLSSTLRYPLFDMTGRRVMSLIPGPNDVSRLAPGVYFVRERSAAGDRRSAVSVRKVVIAE